MKILCSLILPTASLLLSVGAIAQTTITKWQDGKRGAVSITYDDGSINQFRKALPIMNRMNIPATFFIITGQIPGSDYQGRFIGRPVKTIIEETATIATNKDNFYERSSAAGFLGFSGTLDYHTNAGAQIDAGRPAEAYKIIDDLYKKVRAGEFTSGNKTNNEVDEARGVTWDDIRTYAAQGHEFASHTVTHPRLAALDELNMMYELEKSKADILKQLGSRYTFSAEGPYGTENERVMEYAHKVYPALRNRMPETFMEELNRSSRKNPGLFKKEYVQWQRGATTKTPMPLMKSWIDTTAVKDNIWLVLVIHGVDGIGWEALTSQALDEYFQYMKARDKDLWIATFADATKYMRERMNAEIKTTTKKNSVSVRLTHGLDKMMYDIPLTLKTYVPAGWKEIQVKQGKQNTRHKVQQDGNGSFVLYRAVPNSDQIILSKI
ncbi:polysaccharide deacetylase family protein [Daejeonella lutea]|uniref:Peptidoglycan/xylan/chitin deacetylase, PgdA/CDA1 family n=1 Tax=Daejeonella lutea TaxID=572036 RepID=A0A1T5F6U9_9SPHI|nr:polysaccharide deacetylase family protein [Daejeonella lutea]SKB91851.1 Peptidoglycan/xylan/chitin deacetylase, PgdA/CDA1 family [Daejeonella lutea]